MLSINNLPTQDNYVDALTLGPIASAQKVAYLVANNAAIVQLAGHSDDKTIQPWGDQILLTPTTGEFQRVQGMRFKSALSGKPAQIVAQLVEPGDPIPIGGTPFTQLLTSTGSITPGAASVELEHNGLVIATEPIISFDDAGALVWSVADDAPNTRIRVAGPRMITGEFTGAGVIITGSGFTVVRSSAGRYIVTFAPAFAAAPLVVATALATTGNEALTMNQPAPGSVQFNVNSGGAPSDTSIEFFAIAMA